MVSLNLPKAEFKIKSSENTLYIFDIIRKKYVVLTPEEWVRQHVIHYLINIKGYPKSLIAVEKQLIINTLKKRFDILVFNTKGLPDLIIECKSPSINISQDTFDQIARYNLKLNATLLMVTNGLVHYYCELDPLNKQYIFLKDLPDYVKD